MTGHSFLAVDLTSEERHALSASLSEASPGPPIPGRRTLPEMWHITLRFLGECTDSQSERVMHNLSESLSQSVDLASGKVWGNRLGAFPRASKAGVVYVGIDDPSGLLGYLAGICDEAAVDSGFEPEGRPYVPHITLSRLRPALDLRTAIAGYGEFRTPISVRAITLMTVLGSRYEPIDTLALVPPPTRAPRLRTQGS